MKPPLLARRCRRRPSMAASTLAVSSGEQSSTTMTSQAVAGGCAAKACRQARVWASWPCTGMTMLARGASDAGTAAGAPMPAGGAYRAAVPGVPAGGNNCSKSRRQLARRPRVRRLASPRRSRPRARSERSRSSATEVGITSGTPAEVEACVRPAYTRCCARLAHSQARRALSQMESMGRIDPHPHRRRPANGLRSATWKRRALTGLLVAAALGLGFLVPYLLVLDHRVTERFGQLQWQLPTRVFGRPLELRPGMAMDAQTLKTELDAAAYRDDGAGVRPGTYRHEGGQWLIASRGFDDVDGPVAPRRIQVHIADGRVAALRDAARDESLETARLDPARIATLYGQQQEERRLVQLEEVPELLVTTLQAVEDRDFKDHHGIDISGIARAMWANLKAGETVQGASTLTQQLARSGLLGIGNEV